VRRALQDVLPGALSDGFVDTEEQDGVFGEGEGEVGAILRLAFFSPFYGEKMAAAR
jgi:hypothetical protein